MKTVTIDNSIDTELNGCITWQFDNATHLVGTIMMLKDFFDQSTKTMWDNWKRDVADIDTANDFGLAVWGKMLSCRRPTLTYGSPLAEHVLSTNLYRNILKARFQLLNSNASMDDYCKYVYTVFSGKMTAVDGLAMNITFAVASGQTLSAEEAALVTQADDVAFLYPAGVRNNVLQNRVAFGICDTRGSGWDGSFTVGGVSGKISKLDASNATFIWR